MATHESGRDVHIPKPPVVRESTDDVIVLIADPEDGERGIPGGVSVTLSCGQWAPFEVEMVVRQKGHPAQAWRLARELLAGGGEGDVCVTHWPDRTAVRVSSPNGWAELWLPRATVRTFTEGVDEAMPLDKASLACLTDEALRHEFGGVDR